MCKFYKFYVCAVIGVIIEKNFLCRTFKKECQLVYGIHEVVTVTILYRLDFIRCISVAERQGVAKMYSVVCHKLLHRTAET